jgi:hypothetical protein
VLVIKPETASSAKPFMVLVPPLFTTKFVRCNRGPITLAEGVPLLDPGFATYLRDAEAMVILLSICSPLYSISSPLTPVEYIDVDLVSLVGTKIELNYLNQIPSHTFSVFQSRPGQFGLRVESTNTFRKPSLGSVK